MEWIKCSERMPDDYQDVLVTNGTEIDLQFTVKGDWILPGFGYKDVKISHWMPLPAPPAE
ncbi:MULTISPECIES: DUF551 domain-containing protein [Pantoea]|uniref:DUF551 domain-containing protein n=1 Tax=Pantoea TaxID=53335 RepID=UPI002593FF8E|nr:MULTISPECIES: DUF551 domain-containing protein [Pantoea]